MGTPSASSVNYSLRPYLTCASYLDLEVLPSVLGQPPSTDLNATDALFVDETSVKCNFAGLKVKSFHQHHPLAFLCQASLELIYCCWQLNLRDGYFHYSSFPLSSPLLLVLLDRPHLDLQEDPQSHCFLPSLRLHYSADCNSNE